MRPARSGRRAVVALLLVVVSLSSLAEEAEARAWRPRRRAAQFGRVWPHHGPRRPQRDRGHGHQHPGRTNWWDSLFRWGNEWARLHLGALANGRAGGGVRAAPLPLAWTRHFRLEGGAQWWEGPNVCRREEKEGEEEAITHRSRFSSQVCEVGHTTYKCTTKMQGTEGEVTKVELYECCHGYSRKPQDFGCPQKLRLTDLPSTARDLGLNDLLKAVRAAGLEEELARGNFTVFAPVDGAFPLSLGLGSGRTPGLSLAGDQPRGEGVWRPVRDEAEDELEVVVLGHLLPEARRVTSFSDEDVVQTGSPLDSTLRLNFYSRPHRLTTANCVKVTSTDNLATNGVIHVVEKLLPTVTSSLVDLVQQDKQFSYLKTALARANLVSSLQEEGQFTLLAPTNSAFQRLHKALLGTLMAGDPQCLQKVLKHHVLANVICSSIIQGRAKSRNLLNSYLNLTRTEDGKLFANDAQVVRSDIMATNGVMHVIDAVLIPDDALDLVSVAKKNGLTEFVQLTEAASMTSVLQNASDVTVFVPSNEAIQALSPEVRKKLKSDPDLLESVLKYHVVPQTLTCRRLSNAPLLHTLHPKAKVQVNEYSSFPFGNQRVMTAQCAPITVRNVPSCSGVLHVIERVLLPPSGNLMDVLAADSAYSTMVRLLKMAGLADSLQEQGPLTIFTPTNQAFLQLGKAAMSELEADHDQLTALLNTHIVHGHLCCSGIFPSTWWHVQTVHTLSGHALSLSRDRRGRPLVSDAVINSCDNTATNGVVHGIDYVLWPRRRTPWFRFR